MRSKSASHHLTEPSRGIIAIMDYSFMFMMRTTTLEFVYVSESVTEVLGFEQEHLLGRSIAEFTYEDEQNNVIGTLRGIVRNNRAASLLYLQLLHRASRYVTCIMANSVANDIIAGSISQAPSTTVGSTIRSASAEEINSVTNLVQPSGGIWRPPTTAWIRSQLPRTALLLDRFSANCTITHCTNRAILNPDTCVLRRGGFFNYVVERDEASVRAFIATLKRSGIGANSEENTGFAYLTFTMCISGRDLRAPSRSSQASTDEADEIRVSAVGSSSSDGLVLVIKREG